MKCWLLILISIAPLSGINSVNAQSTKPVAVVELFTSEGCSSCPAADELLKEMAAIREKEGKPIIALSFHVTYWNHLGWIDPYSNEVNTKRQEKYRSVLGQNHLYTPQAIVNGAHEFVGSNRIAFRDTLTKVEKKKPAYSIEASIMKKGDSIEIQYLLNKEPKNHLLNIAIVENNSERTVTRGENKSRTLKHYNVVRVFKTMEPKSGDTLTLIMPDDLKPENSTIILYIQNRKTMKIMGAATVSLSEEI